MSRGDEMTLTKEPAVQRDLKTLARFIDVYCRARHADATKTPARLKNFDLNVITGNCNVDSTFGTLMIPDRTNALPRADKP